MHSRRYSRTSGRERGAFLRKIADKIESITGDIVERAAQETALPVARLQGETARTCHQLRLFAQVAEEGSWVNARIDHADPERKPIPKPDIRSLMRPLGPGGGIRREQFSAGILRRRRRHGVGPGGRKHGDREGTCGSSRHQRIGRPRAPGEHSRMRHAGGCLLAVVRTWFADRNRSDETSPGASRRFHRIAHGRANSDGRGCLSPGTNSFLRRDEQYESSLHSAGSFA